KQSYDCELELSTDRVNFAYYQWQAKYWPQSLADEKVMGFATRVSRRLFGQVDPIEGVEFQSIISDTAGPVERKLVMSASLEKYEATTEYSNAIAFDANDASAYANRSFAYLLKRKYSSAIDDAETAIGLEPDNPWAYFNRGSAQLAGEKFD